MAQTGKNLRLKTRIAQIPEVNNDDMSITLDNKGEKKDKCAILVTCENAKKLMDRIQEWVGGMIQIKESVKGEKLAAITSYTGDELGGKLLTRDLVPDPKLPITVVRLMNDHKGLWEAVKGYVEAASSVKDQIRKLQDDGITINDPIDCVIYRNVKSVFTTKGKKLETGESGESGKIIKVKVERKVFGKFMDRKIVVTAVLDNAQNKEMKYHVWLQNLCVKSGDGKTCELQSGNEIDFSRESTQLSNLPPPPQQSSSLPKGWEELKTNEGDVYYYNKSTNVTQWERPTQQGGSSRAKSSRSSKKMNPASDSERYKIICE